MNKKLLGIGVFISLALGAVVSFSVNKAYAYQGDYTKTGPNHTEERELLMEQVIENKDYEGWKELMTEDGSSPGVLRKIDTQDEFNLFAEAYTLGKAGNTEEANAIRAELGLGNGQGNRMGNGMGQRGQNNSGNYADSDNNGVCDNME
jgi:hypothetical protein